jgi:predicted enzyme related to lactoylglutathione lyase
MGQPVVHFEITGADPELLHAYYRELFGWEFDFSSPVSDAISEPSSYGFVQHDATRGFVGRLLTTVGESAGG